MQGVVLMMQYVLMESGGPWYSPSVRAASLLGYRAMQVQTMRFADLKAQLETKLASELKGRSAPSLETIRQWYQHQPDYPESAVREGLVNQGLLPPWAQNQLRLDPPNVQLHQEQSNRWGWGEVLLALGALLLFAVALRQLSNPAPKRQLIGTRPLGRIARSPPFI